MKTDNLSCVPKVRFPGFDEPWKVVRLGDMAMHCVDKNSAGKVLRVFTNSATDGVVDQAAYFDGQIANSQSIDRYTIVNQYDFVYNPRVSSVAPVGPISINKQGIGVMSPIYLVFHFTKGVTGFYEYFFQTERWHHYLKSISNTGARFDRLNVSLNDFFNMPVPFPSLDEQQRIASCLTSLDDIIKETERKIESLKKHKKGLMQRLFANQMSSGSGSSGFAKGWMGTTLGEICEMAAGRYISASEISSSGTYPCYGGNGLRGYTQKANITGVHPIIGRQGALCGNVLLADGSYYATEHAVVVTNKPVADVIFLYHLLNYLDLNKYATGQAQPGLSVAKMLLVSCQIPTSMVQQQQIASCLSSIDDIITSYEEKVKLLRLHKKGLMQQLFPPMNVNL